MRLLGRLGEAASRVLLGVPLEELKRMRDDALIEQDPYRAASLWKKLLKKGRYEQGLPKDPEEEARSDLAGKTLDFLTESYRFTLSTGSNETFGDFLDRAFRAGFDIGEKGYTPLGEAFNSLLPFDELHRRCHSLTLTGSLAPIKPGLEQAVAKLYTPLSDVNAANQALIEFDFTASHAFSLAQKVDQAFLIRCEERVNGAGRERRAVDEELRIETTLTDLLEPIQHPDGTPPPYHQALQVGVDLLTQVVACEGKVLATDENQRAYQGTRQILERYAHLAPDATMKIGAASVNARDVVPHFDHLIEERIGSVRPALEASHTKLYKATVQAFRGYSGRSLGGKTVEQAQQESPGFADALRAFSGFTRTYFRVLNETETDLGNDIAAIPKESAELGAEVLPGDPDYFGTVTVTGPPTTTTVAPPPYIEIEEE